MKYQKRTNKFGLGGGGHRYKRTCIRKGKCTLKRGRPMFSFICNSNRKLNGRARNRLKICISKFKLNYKINKAKQQPCFDSEYDIVYRDTNYLKAILKKKKLPTQNGYRFIDLQQMQSFISQVTMHSISCERAVEIALKGISPYTDLTEIKSYGIACILGIKCKGCNYIHTMNTSSRLQTSKDKINRFDVNVRAVWGSMVTGNGASHLNELLGTMNSPGLRQATFGSIEEEIGQMWHTVLEEEMLAAGAEERRIAIENNNYNEGVPSITVIADGGWSKRSHKHTYNASGGVAIIVGKQTGKILYIGVRNKYCYICSRALNTQTEPPEHVCFKNWSASSQAMESDILVEGFKQAEKVHGLRYMQLIADGDSSVYAKIQEEVPIWGKFVTKMECSNHACKCLRSNLEKLVNDNPNYKGQNKLTKTTRVKIVSAVRCAIRMRSKESNRSAAIKLLAHDIRNSVHHIFGNHKNCSNFCKANEKRNETSIASSDNLSTNDIPDIFESQSLLWSEGTSLLAQEESRFSSNLIYTDLDKQMLSDITLLLNRLATKSERLVGNDTTNIAESWMHVRSKFDGGKFYNLCNRGSWHARCYGAAARQNLGPAWAPQVWSKTTGNEAGFYFKTVYNRRKKHLINTKIYTNKPEQKTRRWKRKMKSWTDSTTKKARYEYGPDSMEVTKDVEKLELDQLKDNYISHHIELTNDQILAIERQTKTQSNSQVWKTERKKRLTASNFGKIVKRNTKLKIKPLISELLYSSFKGNAYTVKGLQEERNSIHEYILKKTESGVNVNVESSGLIIDKNHKFLAGSPDGLVNENGEMGLIEIKNILQKKNMSFIQATKKVSNFCLQYTDEKVQLKKKHNYYFQCQGLLNISGLPWLDFIARSTSPYQIHIERIYRDEVLWNDTMLPKLEAFYFLALLPELAAPRYNKSPGIREPGDWFLVNTSKKKTSTRNRRNPRKIAVAKKKTTIRKDTDNSTTNKKQSSKNASNSKTTIKPSTSTTEQYTVKRKKSMRCSNTKFVGRRIKHKWMVNEEEIWYEGTVLAAVTGKDGERLAEYDILYDGEDSSCIVNHLVEDFRDSSVQFIDL
ncbi:Hypothetical predicted protein [Mytilus galloprovincialis]|uniref:YqaJ viral recombinase domain-containing protein n=2 Tax=Mytilus galloprovincialis TaxID=29158 RepID=A0A8B6HNE0_MYTGA|nr:Hypothetical predicted protein [Mytilus galloprovincialis]